ncbi:DNA glycosylase [Kocuria flava]|uniref:DNA-(apurinic or apyrimidinic site) lyase n=1 Tax=Kocuria flava TaxID=446860 RepID=A0A0U3I4Z8_9MICC|nr:DNA-formamidopyrimidine glycosylase family protein [Kocuria flava]ALU38476.1 DNA glycosylase [Kocuria flava]MCJ8504162.1 Fpg/Nei family DNA glycosylase [Kocuria flava]GEO93006.1 formamidopyrimidine-DNA glycosylase [Kocuria flava]
MPEGDTVYRQAALLRRALAGQVLVRSDLRFPSIATADLSGRTVTEVVPRGKHLLVRTDGGPEGLTPLSLHSHLLMEGMWHVYPRGARWRRPGHQARAVLETARAQAVGFDLGMLDLVPTAGEDEVVGHLGPDLLGPDWDRAAALGRLAAVPGRRIGAALMDQRNLAGIGNVYRNEVLFLGRVHPFTAVADVPDPGALVDLAHRLLHVNRDRSQRSTVGGPARRGEQFWVYGRGRQPCRRCGARITEARIDDAELGPGRPGPGPPRDRAVWFCERCQPRA